MVVSKRDGGNGPPALPHCHCCVMVSCCGCGHHVMVVVVLWYGYCVDLHFV